MLIVEIKTLVLGELETNCYLVIDQNTNQCIIIDPADEADFISEQILRLKVKPLGVLATHGHFDHILAANELQLAFNIPFYIHEKDLFLVKNLKKNASFWTERKIVEKPPKKICFFPKNFKFKISNLKFTIIPTPGHTPGSVCLYFQKENVIFTGDTLFADGIGRTDLSYSSEKDLLASLKKLSQFPPKTKIYPGHGRYGATIKEVLSLFYSYLDIRDAS